MTLVTTPINYINNYDILWVQFSNEQENIDLLIFNTLVMVW